MSRNVTASSKLNGSFCSKLKNCGRIMDASILLAVNSTAVFVRRLYVKKCFKTDGKKWGPQEATGVALHLRARVCACVCVCLFVSGVMQRWSAHVTSFRALLREMYKMIDYNIQKIDPSVYLFIYLCFFMYMCIHPYICMSV
jgi:hypothetical protein